jgi:hypothetical protein
MSTPDPFARYRQRYEPTGPDAPQQDPFQAYSRKYGSAAAAHDSAPPPPPPPAPAPPHVDLSRIRSLAEAVGAGAGAGHPALFPLDDELPGVVVHGNGSPAHAPAAPQRTGRSWFGRIFPRAAGQQLEGVGETAVAAQDAGGAAASTAHTFGPGLRMRYLARALGQREELGIRPDAPAPLSHLAAATGAASGDVAGVPGFRNLLAAGAEYAGQDPDAIERGGRQLADAGRRIQERNPVSADVAAMHGPKKYLNGRWLLEQGGPSAIQFLAQAALARGVGGIAGQTAGTAVFAASAYPMELGQARHEVEQTFLEQGLQPDEASRRASEIGQDYALVAALLESIPGHVITEHGGRRAVARLLLGAASEGATEAAQQAAQQVMQYAGTGDHQYIDRLGEQVADAGVLGFVTGGLGNLALGERPHAAAAPPAQRRAPGEAPGVEDVPAGSAAQDAMIAVTGRDPTAVPQLPAPTPAPAAATDGNPPPAAAAGASEAIPAAAVSPEAPAPHGAPAPILEAGAEHPRRLMRIPAPVEGNLVKAPAGAGAVSVGPPRDLADLVESPAPRVIRRAGAELEAGEPAPAEAVRSDLIRSDHADERPALPPTVAEVPTASLHRDPARFQYKQDVDERGVTRELKSVRAYDPNLAGVLLAWRDPVDGRDYVVNGHHRHELAQRAAAAGQPQAERMLVRYLDAPNAESARTVGALANIAEGRGTAVDAAKLFREQGATPELLAEKGISITGAIARDGLALARLDPHIFHLVATGEMPVARGAAIGAAGLSPTEQHGLMQLLQRRGERITNAEISELARFVKGAGTESVSQETLFGDEHVDHSLALEKAQLSAWVRTRLAGERRLFGFVARGDRAAQIEGQGAGRIDTARSGDLASAAAQAEEIYTRLSSRSGPVSEALNDAARRLKQGEKLDALRQQLYARVRDAVAGEIAGATSAPVSFTGSAEGADAGGDRGAGAPGVDGEPAEVAQPDAETASLFSEDRPAYGADLFGAPPAAAPPAQTDLLGHDSGPVGISRALQEARQIVSSLDGKVARGAASRTELERYRAARALLQRGEKLGPEDLARLRSESSRPAARDPEVIDLFQESQSPELQREHAELTFGSEEQARAVAEDVEENSGRFATVRIIPEIATAAERAAAVARGIEAGAKRAWVSLQGKRIRLEGGLPSGRDLHQLLHPFRSPVSETLHVLYLDEDGTVVGHTADSSGAIDYVETGEGFAERVLATAQRLGVTKVALAHNHPSGNPGPSGLDVHVTAYHQLLLRDGGVDLVGHYVINHVRGVLIPPQANVRRADAGGVQFDWVGGIRFDFSGDQPAAPDWTDLHAPLRLTAPSDVFNLLRATSDPARIDVLYLSSRLEPVALQPHAPSAVESLHEWMPGQLRALGAADVVLSVGSMEDLKRAAAVVAAHRQELASVRDVIWAAGGESAMDLRLLEHAQDAPYLPAVRTIDAVPGGSQREGAAQGDLNPDGEHGGEAAGARLRGTAGRTSPWRTGPRRSLWLRPYPPHPRCTSPRPRSRRRRRRSRPPAGPARVAAPHHPAPHQPVARGRGAHPRRGRDPAPGDPRPRA